MTMGFVCGVLILLTLPALALTTVLTSKPQFELYCLRTPKGPVCPTILFDPTNPNRYKMISQQRENHSETFVTLYDTRNRIPVFSSYDIQHFWEITEARSTWYIEPQLDDPRGGSYYQKPQYPPPVQNLGIFQAVDEDYEGSGYDKGQLLSVVHADTDANTTFTLTNTVPMDRGLNQVWWRDMELAVNKYMDNNCTRSGQDVPRPLFAVTGAVPGGRMIGKGRVNVPEYLWTAFCCHDKMLRQWVSKAHLAPNDNSETVLEMSLRELEMILNEQTVYSQNYEPFVIFGEECYTDINSTHIYSHQRI